MSDAAAILADVTFTIPVDRWCPRCERIFRAEKPVGVDETGAPVCCPSCGTAGESLLSRE